MAKKKLSSLSFHYSHIKWILFAYTLIHLSFVVLGLSLLILLPEKYMLILWCFIGLETALAVQCLIIRPPLKRFAKQGHSLMLLYLGLRIAKNLIAALFLLFSFPNMFPDLFSLIFTTSSTIFSNGMSVLLVAPAFVVCVANLFLCINSLIYYLRHKEKFTK